MASMTRCQEQGHTSPWRMKRTHAGLEGVEPSQGHRQNMTKRQTRVGPNRVRMARMTFDLSRFGMIPVHKLCIELVHQLQHMYRLNMARMLIFQVMVVLYRLGTVCMTVVLSVIVLFRLRKVDMLIVQVG
jgi:hypothetical protein